MASCRNSLLSQSLAPAVPSYCRPAPVGSAGRQGSIPCPQGRAGPEWRRADHGSTVAIGPIALQAIKAQRCGRHVKVGDTGWHRAWRFAERLSDSLNSSTTDERNASQRCSTKVPRLAPKKLMVGSTQKE